MVLPEGPTPGDALTYSEGTGNADTEGLEVRSSLSDLAGQVNVEQKGARYLAAKASEPWIPPQHPRACGGRTTVSGRFSSTEDHSWTMGALSSSKLHTSFRGSEWTQDGEKLIWECGFTKPGRGYTAT